MKAIKFGALPFESLKIVYFKAYDKEQTLPFFDAEDEQILIFLTKNFHETAVILRIEDVEVLNVNTYIPKKKKLDHDELKHGLTNEEIEKRNKKIIELKNKVEEKE